jgi:DNA-binding transcriptional LysR family regulator
LRDAQITALIAIWQAGGFRAAARRLDVAEPTLQRPARELERLLRVNLFRRTAAGVETNATGAELARRLALALGEIHSGMEEIGAPSANDRASLRVGVLALSPRVIVADALRALTAAYPKQRVDIVEGSYEQHAAAIRSGSIDVILGALRSPPMFDDLVGEPLLEDPYAIVCRAGHPLAKLRAPKPNDLSAYEFVLPSRGLPRRATLDAFFEAHNIAPIARVETSCLPTTLALLKTSDRLSLLSRWHADLDNRYELARLDGITAEHAPRLVGLTTRANWLPTPFQAVVLRMARAAAANWADLKADHSDKGVECRATARTSPRARTSRNTRAAPTR